MSWPKAPGSVVSGAGSPRVTDIPYIASGLTLPVTGLIANPQYVSSGDATINGIRVVMLATVIPLTASKDHYVDLIYSASTFAGSYTVTPVANGTTAPALPANALRLGYVATNATAITGAYTNAKDSSALGNWMGNTLVKPTCILATGTQTIAGSAAIVTFNAASEILDNAYMHNGASNSSRITLPKTGLYRVDITVGWGPAPTGTNYCALYKNGSISPVPNKIQSSLGGYSFTPGISFPFPATAGDYLEMYVGGAASTEYASFAVSAL